MGKQSFSCSGMTEIILALGFLVLFFVSVSRSNRHQCTCCTHAHYQWGPITSYILYGQSEDFVSSFTFPNQKSFNLPNLFPMSMQFKYKWKMGEKYQPFYASRKVPEIILLLHQMKYKNFTLNFLNISIWTFSL